MIGSVPATRLRKANTRAVRRDGSYVLYWMIAARRRRSNFALQRAVEWARELGKPLLVLEALRSGYRWASDRLHAFVIQGMAANAGDFDVPGVRYYPYVEPTTGAGANLLFALARDAAVVVTDEFPCFFLPRMLDAAARGLPTALEVVDSCGILPLRATDRVFQRAYDFRRYVHRVLAEHYHDRPAPDPLRRGLSGTVRLPSETTDRWPAATRTILHLRGHVLAGLPIDHRVHPSPVEGGPAAGRQALDRFLRDRLPRYGELRNVPDEPVTSGLSPFLHFGHVSVYDVVRRLAQTCSWSPDRIDRSSRGSRDGWGADANVTGFLDELVVWRELGYNMSALRDDADQYDALPDWARETLARHASDRREPTYAIETFDAAETHDELWNAAQRQLVREGRVHSYLRMLWGKKILQWSASPRDAAAIMIELNNRYALDGRDPNSYSGIFWVLGRYDRPWGPERPVFGKVRYMSSENTARKVRVKKYLERYGPGS